MSDLPQKQTLDQMQTKWASILNPVIKAPTNNASILQSVSLVVGTNSVNHLLGQKLQGWYIVRLRAASTIYDMQDTNQTPQLTLVLNASAPVVVDLAVF